MYLQTHSLQFIEQPYGKSITSARRPKINTNALFKGPWCSVSPYSGGKFTRWLPFGMCQSPTKLKSLQAFIDTENSENAGFTAKVNLSLLPTQRLSGEFRALLACVCLAVGMRVQSSSACPKFTAMELESCCFQHLNLQFSYRKGQFITDKITNCACTPRKLIQKLHINFLGPVTGICRFKRMFWIRR